METMSTLPLPSVVECQRWLQIGSATMADLHLKKHLTDDVRKKSIFQLPYQSKDSVPLYCLHLVTPAGGFPVKALTVPSSWNFFSLTRPRD